MGKKKNVILFLFFISVFFFFFLPPLDTDLGWLLRYGEHFWKTGEILKTNTFTVLNPNYHWPNSYFWYEALIYPIYHTLGFWGLSLLSSIVYISIFYLLYLLTKRNLAVVFLSFPIVVYISWVVFFFGLRAQVFSLLYFLILLLLLTFNNVGKASTPTGLLSVARNDYLIPLLFILWTNTHGAFVYGLAVVGIWGILNQKIVKLRVGLLLLLSFFATLVSPYGLSIYSEEIRHMVVPLKTLIAEWTTPSLFIAGVVIIITIFSIFKILLIYKERKLTREHLFYFILLLLFALLSLSAERNLPYFAFISVIYLGHVFSGDNRFFSSLNKIFFPFLILLLFVSVNYGLLNTVRINSSWNNYCNAYYPYPYRAVKFLQKEKKGNVFNAYEWGGFLEWQLPNFIYFVDGRMPAWPTPEGKSPYTIYLEVMQTKTGWNETLSRYKIDYVFIRPGTFLDLELSKGNSKWKEIYRDQISVIYQESNI